MIAVTDLSEELEQDHPLAGRYFMIREPFPHYGYSSAAGEPKPVLLPTEWGLVLGQLPERGYFMVRTLGMAGGSFDVGDDRITKLEDMATWLWFEDRDEMREEFDSTWSPVWELYGMEKQWAAERAAEQLERPAPPKAGELKVRTLRDVPTVDDEEYKRRLRERRDA